MATYSAIAHNFTPPSATTSAQVGAGAMTLIKTLTASSSGTISFQDGSSDVVMDNTYKTYLFKYIDVHSANDFVNLSFQGNVAGGSGFNETIQSATFEANLSESDSHQFQYSAGVDQQSGTGFQPVVQGVGNGNDESCSGYLCLFDPSNTTFVKHFIARTSGYYHGDGNSDSYAAGYFNTTSAIDEIQFKMSSGNIDSGTIKLYGIS